MVDSVTLDLVGLGWMKSVTAALRRLLPAEDGMEADTEVWAVPMTASAAVNLAEGKVAAVN